MYLNEAAWKTQQDNPYIVNNAMENFLHIYKTLASDFHITELYVPADEKLYLRSKNYSIEKWLSEADIEYKRLYLSFWNKRISYTPEDEYELSYKQERLAGGTEAYLNDSFLISICLNEFWREECISAKLFSLADCTEETVIMHNVFSKNQLLQKPVADFLKNIPCTKLYSYNDLWQRRGQLFPHLKFCPSIENDLNKLEKLYLRQVIRKLTELENYCRLYKETSFNPNLLTKTTLESDSTIAKYTKQHTFTDENGKAYVAKWHMRFTGIPGRIFFIPDYEKDFMLICYIGRKLPNVTYPT